MLMNQGSTLTNCPCGSGKTFEDCCEPITSGAQHATTAEALMRSRYTAFAIENLRTS